MNEQKIIIKNTKSSSIMITVKEHVPKSTDEKIKIKLISPELDKKDANEQILPNSHDWEPTVGVRLDPNHNLEWTVKLDANQEEQLSVKWSLEHPSGESVTFQEVFSQGNLN
ncbi:unnamed protein product [Gongylonema pulchrum]|uniref:DUF4139 domain-containing protein n=1 Tax=Gongylonema pulchrum TaxID=637853 RepID=A0A183EML1_9BILA|nr:unnamed protein product [Gongylonema pulchrum]